MAAVIAAAPGPCTGSVNANANYRPGVSSSRPLSISTSISQDSAGSSPASPSHISTPTSSCSSGNAPPIAIRPVNRAVNNMASPPAASPGAGSQPVVALSMTSKEWVIPPRPKPGRKPATDTPPTKRKAQNRAAQRAFRERRAARVGELEEQLEEQKEEYDRIIQEMQERMDHMEHETQSLQTKCHWLEEQLERARQGRESVSNSWDNSHISLPSGSGSLMPTSLHQQQQHQQSSINMSHSVRPIQPAPPKNMSPNPATIAEPRALAQPFSISQIISPAEQTTGSLNLSCGGCQTTGSCACAEEVLQTSDIPIGCGNCTLGGRCACLEESIKSAIAASDLKRRRSSGSPSRPDEKRQRSDAGALNLETDFTALFAAKDNRMSMQSVNQPPVQQQQQSLSMQPMMSLETRDCGFCKDGTYCICADMMAAPIPSIEVPVSQPVVHHTQTHTPPPSDDDVIPMPMEVTATGAIKLPGPRRPAAQAKSAPARTGGGCGPNGPGTCAQCLSDPKSGLFCRSLAANFEKNNPGSSAGGGCCGGGGPGGCCKTAKPETTSTNNSDTLAPIQSSPPSANHADGFRVSLSCAEAFKTLASHRHFEEAADDIGSWLPKLRALPVLRQGAAAGPMVAGKGLSAGRAPIEVEAASIMSVLKDFDVRFGRGE
ncbi:hypothetical protein QBC44DRAFT_321224 [Cladorrhinum sp. PSN332]|nr:hypothetical protein QBC44DRAFT_321224 [Cladorrhinum sp. PSN332]